MDICDECFDCIWFDRDDENDCEGANNFCSDYVENKLKGSD